MCQCGGLTEILDNMQGQDSWKGHLKAKGGQQRLPVLLTWGGQSLLWGRRECVQLPPHRLNQQHLFLRSCFFNFAVTVEGFMTISVNRVATHIGLPKNQLPDSSSEAELSSVQMGWVWCQSVAYRHEYDLIFKM